MHWAKEMKSDGRRHVHACLARKRHRTGHLLAKLHHLFGVRQEGGAGVCGVQADGLQRGRLLVDDAGSHLRQARASAVLPFRVAAGRREVPEDARVHLRTHA